MRTARSRGLLVVDALGQPSAAEAAEEVERACAERHSPFNLLAADGRSSCPAGEAGCPGIAFLTLRRFVLEGTRWLGINIQDDEIRKTVDLGNRAGDTGAGG